MPFSMTKTLRLAQFCVCLLRCLWSQSEPCRLCSEGKHRLSVAPQNLKFCSYCNSAVTWLRKCQACKNEIGALRLFDTSNSILSSLNFGSLKVHSINTQIFANLSWQTVRFSQYDLRFIRIHLWYLPQSNHILVLLLPVFPLLLILYKKAHTSLDTLFHNHKQHQWKIKLGDTNSKHYLQSK